MATQWKWQSTSKTVHVDLSEFDQEQLLQALIDAEWVTEAEAAAIAERARSGERLEAKAAIKPPPFPPEELEAAGEELRCGRRVEALIHVERFLGREWAGVLT